jgi:3-phenylpropionate/cinnamic acid dioxygenase small subunit
MFDARTQTVWELLAREATLVDERRWDEWLQLFDKDVEYWIPAWDSETEFTTNPETELSLVYYPGRFGLEDRVFRIRSGTSSASVPPPRTCHLVSGILCEFQADGSCVATANWSTHVYQFKTTNTFYGNYRYLLEPHEGGWRIKKKRILVLNDAISTALDIYCV